MLVSLRSAVALSIALLAACGSVPKSSIDTPTVFTAAETNPYLIGEPVVQEFWKSFDDPVLDSLVQRALLANRDLRATQARLRQSRALANQSKTDYLPGGSLSIQDTETRAGLAAATSRYTGTAQAQWEIDLFGRITNGVMARSADARAALADLHAARVSVTSETARIYFQLRGANTRLSVARRSADNQRQSLNITQARFEEGAGSELDLQRARAQLQTTLATIPSLETQQQQLLNQLAVLLGEPAGQVAQPEILSVEAIALPELVPVGNPAEWLRRRPDIRRAEARLESTAAAARVSVASLFPRVSISGTATAAAADVGSLFEKANNTLLWGPTLSWAVLNIPRLLYDVAAQSARRDESLASYEHTVLTALAETESALSAYRFSRQRVAELEAAVTASERAEELSRIRYDAGAADFLSVLDAQRTQLQVADQLAQSRSDRAGALVAVYKALGVGWGLNDAAQALAR